MLRHYADSITWAQRSIHHHQARVQHTGTDWNGLIINFYPSTNTVLFQGNPTIATHATEMLLEFINLRNNSEQSTCAPAMPPHRKDDEDDDDSINRWPAGRLKRPPRTTSHYNNHSSPHQHLNAHSSSREEKSSYHTTDALLSFAMRSLTALLFATLRPTHANSGVRIGEAANPGPTARSRKSKKQTEDNVYSVKKIVALDSKISQLDHHEAGTIQYLINWCGKDKEGNPYADSWESEHNLNNCAQKLYAFHSNADNSDT
jgi:hypothetical protein